MFVVFVIANCIFGGWVWTLLPWGALSSAEAHYQSTFGLKLMCMVEVAIFLMFIFHEMQGVRYEEKVVDRQRRAYDHGCRVQYYD